MSKPTGKLAMAYSTIATMEARIKELECQRPAGVAVPDGWKLVPIEPTEEMTWVSPLESSPETLRHLWEAMLAAAPHPVTGDRKAQDLDGLVAFANAMIDIAFEDGEADGGHIQGEAEKHGLLVKHERQSRCQEEFCNCAIYGFPTDCYVRSEQLRAHRAQQGEQP